MDRKTLVSVLNQPITIWFLTSVIIGLVTWQYGEFKSNTEQEKKNAQILRKAELELSLLTKDVEFILSKPDLLTMPLVQQAGMKLQYNSYSSGSSFYFPSLMNIMLELDSRKKVNGLDKFIDKLYAKMATTSKAVIRIQSRVYNPTQNIWELFTQEEKAEFDKLRAVVKDIRDFYQQK